MKTIVCTLAMGPGPRVDHVNRLIDTFTRYSDYDIIVFTDQDTDTINTDRVITLSDITDVPVRIRTSFNYNLKGIVTQYTYNTFPEYDRVLWCDCDVFMSQPCPEFDAFTEADMYCRNSPFPPRNPNAAVYVKYLAVLEELGLEDKYYETMPYITEIFLLLIRGEKATAFVNRWGELCTLVSKNIYIN